MASHDLTFGVFVPQGWKMELVAIEDSQAKWAKAVEVVAVNEAGTLDAVGPQNALGARMIGWFSEFGAVVIPTVGFFIRSQMFFHALVVEQNFPSLSRGSRTLLGLGFSQAEAKRLGRQLCDVGALVYVSCRENAKADGAIELLRRTGAREAASLLKAAAVAA